MLSKYCLKFQLKFSKSYFMLCHMSGLSKKGFLPDEESPRAYAFFTKLFPNISKSIAFFPTENKTLVFVL